MPGLVDAGRVAFDECSVHQQGSGITGGRADAPCEADEDVLPERVPERGVHDGRHQTRDRATAQGRSHSGGPTGVDVGERSQQRFAQEVLEPRPPGEDDRIVDTGGGSDAPEVGARDPVHRQLRGGGAEHLDPGAGDHGVNRTPRSRGRLETRARRCRGAGSPHR